MFSSFFLSLCVDTLIEFLGPKSGGTDVILYGTDLDAGSEVHVSFGEVKCEVYLNEFMN